jgi:hypothetical protein
VPCVPHTFLSKQLPSTFCIGVLCICPNLCKFVYGCMSHFCITIFLYKNVIYVDVHINFECAMQCLILISFYSNDIESTKS